MKRIELVLSEGIKKGMWIDIAYKNKFDEVTYYWIAIEDIDFKKKILYVSMFNDKLSLDTVRGAIKFDNIISAKLLEFTTYETPNELITKIEKHRDDAKWLKFETFNNNILRYYLECNELDNDPYQKDSFLIPGVDKALLLKNKFIVLNNEQEKCVLNYIKNYDKRKLDNKTNYFALSFLSIEDNSKKYVILYYDVSFNPKTKKLSINFTPRVNQSFLIEDKKHSITSYIDIDPTEFVNNITNHLNIYLKDYIEIIRENLNSGEIINEMPEFMILQRNYGANLEATYNIIEERIESGNLEYPLKAFFGNSNRFGAKKKEPSIVIYDDKVNIDQMRVIYNTMKYPITYVQGPPGTGKTQTILNVILSNFFNSKTTLICSSNNKPINGILEKLSFSYKDNIEIPFPFLRLGNRNEVVKATERILNLYKFQYRLTPDEKKLHKIKKDTNNVNKDLLNHLEAYEEKNNIKLKLDCAKRLLTSINNPNNRLYESVKKQIDELNKYYNTIPETTNSDVLNLVYSVSNDKKFKEYMFFESIKYVNKLKLPKYNELISICSIDDIEERISEFNGWCSSDENIKLLESVFPIIITTNISSSRLGTANHHFDLVVMDEAGQCNCATAILPIARAKSLLLVGDSNQLKPVILLEDVINDRLKKEYLISDDYDYSKHSILDVMRIHDKISKDIMLTYHYRCGRKIIDFSNKRFYNGKLNLDHLKKDGDLTLLNVKNINSKKRNENYEEAQAIIKYVKRNNLNDVAIITPFKNQQVLINELIRQNNLSNVSCGTIHQFQGAEKNTIIISSSISPKTSKKTFEWIKNNAEITNVAVTRAKERLIMVSDLEALEVLSTDKNNDLYSLANYIKSNGKCEVVPNESYSIQIGNSNGSKNEDMFFETISHFCSVNNNFQAKRNIKLASLFSSDPILSKSKLEFDVVLYQIKDNALSPKIVIELQGGEHFGDIDRERCDTRKSIICKEKGIILLEVPNSFAKSYEAIKELIMLSCGQKLEQLELF